jgi:predicted RNA-binding protein with PIN domain
MDAFQQARKYGKATNPEYNDISYAASNEAKARIIMEYGGRTMSRKELVEYINDYKRKTGKPINGSEILREYQKETGYGK